MYFPLQAVYIQTISCSIARNMRIGYYIRKMSILSNTVNTVGDF